jgi:hypothetical protein
VAHCEKQLAEILTLLDTVPTVVAVHLERPAVIPEIAERSAALAAPEGTLPFQLPRSMEPRLTFLRTCPARAARTMLSGRPLPPQMSRKVSICAPIEVSRFARSSYPRLIT